jgi:hypothetical protein
VNDAIPTVASRPLVVGLALAFDEYRGDAAFEFPIARTGHVPLDLENDMVATFLLFARNVVGEVLRAGPGTRRILENERPLVVDFAEQRDRFEEILLGLPRGIPTIQSVAEGEIRNVFAHAIDRAAVIVAPNGSLFMRRSARVGARLHGKMQIAVQSRVIRDRFRQFRRHVVRVRRHESDAEESGTSS